VARRSIGWPAGFWLTACAGLAAVVAYQLSSSFPLAPTVTAAPPGTPALDLAERPALPRPPDEHALELIAARPLFSEGRRPYEPPPEPVEAAAPEPSQPGLPLELAGTYLTGTDQAALLLVAGGTPAWLRKGQQIEGWQVEAIAQNHVELRKDGRHQVLQLRDDITIARPAKPSARQAGRDDAASHALDSEPADEEEYEDEDEGTPQ
jgi:Type II secretion system protein C